MKLIIGLGNPGLIYNKTRHNLGALVVKKVAKEFKTKLKLDRSLKSRIAKIDILDKVYLLAIPNTFMNLAGEAVDLLLHSKKISFKDLLVIHDDVDLELGAMRFRKTGSSGGHKGIESIIKTLNTQDFARLKLGIGRSFCNKDIKDYVLSHFSKEELKIINPLIQKAAKACKIWVKSGTDRVMNEFNSHK